MHKRIFTIKRDLNLLKQKMETAGHFVYQGGMFSADKDFLAYVNALDDKSCVQDLNGNPVLIEDIDENLFGNFLYTQDVPDPDIMIRTSGEQRISNFLLWQICYTELFFLDVLWPDLTEQHLSDVILEYSKRDRRYGK